MQRLSQGGTVAWVIVAGFLLTVSQGLAEGQQDSTQSNGSNRGDGGGIGPDSPSHRSTARADRAARGREQRAAIRNPDTAGQTGGGSTTGRQGVTGGDSTTGRQERFGTEGGGLQHLNGSQGIADGQNRSGNGQAGQRSTGQAGQRDTSQSGQDVGRAGRATGQGAQLGTGQAGQAGNQSNQGGAGMQGQQGAGQAGQAGTGQSAQRGAGQAQPSTTYRFGEGQFGQSSTSGGFAQQGQFDQQGRYSQQGKFDRQRRLNQQGVNQQDTSQFGQRSNIYGYQGGTSSSDQGGQGYGGGQSGQGDTGYWTRQSKGQQGTGRYDDIGARTGGTQYGQRGGTGTWGRERDRGGQFRSQPGGGTYGYGDTSGSGRDTYGYGDQDRGTGQRSWKYDNRLGRSQGQFGQRSTGSRYGQRDAFSRQGRLDSGRDRFDTYNQGYDRMGRRGTDWYGRDAVPGNIYGYGTDRFGEGGRYGDRSGDRYSAGQNRFGRDTGDDRYQSDPYRGAYRSDRGSLRGYWDEGDDHYEYRLDDDDFDDFDDFDDDDFEYEPWDD